MPLRFRKSIRLGGGVRLNLGKRSVGISAGIPGFRYSVNTSGRRTRTLSIPGTGLSHASSSNSSTKRGTARQTVGATSQQSRPIEPSAALPKPGLFAPTSEKRFHEGLVAYLKGDFARALVAFEAASARDSRNVSDDLFAGLTAQRLDELEKAITFLERVIASDIELPDQLLTKYLPPERATLALTVNITSRVSAAVPVASVGAALILAELYQQSGRLEEAIGLIQRLLEVAEEDQTLRLSLCDLLEEDVDYEGIIDAVGEVENDSDIGLALMHLKAKALAVCGLQQAALGVFASCLRRTAGRDRQLLKEIRYDRASFLETLGDSAKARSDWERLYADDATYRDVARHVGRSKI